MIINCTMSNNLLDNLNDDQKKAVTATDGPILILAGAGSGKTRVLTYKVAYLIAEKNIDPDNILMVTFTNKAAGEMKKRIKNLLAEKTLNNNMPWTSTFHSFCARILRREGKSLGLAPNFTIYDDTDTKEAILAVMNDLGINKKNISISGVASTIAEAKNELINPSEYKAIAQGFFQEAVAQIYPKYQNILLENQALDFEDLIFKTVKLFQSNSPILQKYQGIFSYILIDEYQDTNNAQYVLSNLISRGNNNLTVVGDASQSIYAWRGADFRNILRFRKDHPDAKIFHLEKNYRSTQIILDAAHSIISKNQSHPILKLWTDKKVGTKITIYEAPNEHYEANFIVDQLTNRKIEDAAVLFRTNAQSRLIEEALLHAGIPYILVGGVRFYERKEIKDILSYLRIMVNIKDSVSMKRAEKIGKKRLEMFFKFREKIKTDEKNPDTLTLLDDIINATNFLSLYNKDIPEDLSRLENIKELRSVAKEFPDITQFLENVALIEKEYSPDHPLLSGDNKKKITLMTMHAAKGLEFKTVFITGMEEGLFPHSMSLINPAEIEEERRLCYVGLTRACDKLFLSYARNRLYFGQRTSNMVSRFIEEIPTELVENSGDDVL